MRSTTPKVAEGSPAGSPKTMSGKTAKAAAKPADRLTGFIIVPTLAAGLLSYALWVSYHAGKAAMVDNPFGSTPVAAPVIATALYMTFVLVAGPRLMANRPEFKLKNCMLVYNVYQTALNIVTCYYFVKLVGDLGMSWWGNKLDLSHRTYDLGFWIWVHYTNKYVELLDTVFMILRKKSEQVSFLHVYHHCLLIWAWFLVSKVACGGDAYFGALANSFIHVLMYSYYAMALLVRPPARVACWPRVCGAPAPVTRVCVCVLPRQRITVPWKKVLTQLQMVQFVVCATHSFYVMYTGCYPTKMALLELWVMFNMLFLFWNFYSNKYNRGKGEWCGVRAGVPHNARARLTCLCVWQ